MKSFHSTKWIFRIAALGTVAALLSWPDSVAAGRMPSTAVVQNASRMQTKLCQLQQAHFRGLHGAKTSASSEEITAMILADLQPVPTPSGTTPEKIHNARVVFDGNEVKAQFEVEVMHKSVPVTTTGRIVSENGYAIYQPTTFHIGHVPLPASVVRAQIDRRFDNPETRGNFRLPDYISQVRVENSQLVIVER
jgi:hypothetical protein